MILTQFIKNKLFLYLPEIFHKYQYVTTNTVGVCTLLRHIDVDMFIWNLTSFFYFSKIVLPVYIVDDGTLTRKDCQKLKNHFQVLIEKSQSSERKMSEKISKFPWLSKFRFDPKAYINRKKFDAYLLNPFSKFIYLDSDVLFIKQPMEIVEWINSATEDSYYSGHLPYPSNCFGYINEIVIHSFRLLLFRNFKNSINPTFNSGLLCIANKHKLRLNKIDEILQFFYENAFAHHNLAEEISFAFALSSSHFRLLPPEKYVNVWADEEYNKSVTQKTISIHYSAGVKFGHYKKDAIRLACLHQFLDGWI